MRGTVTGQRYVDDIQPHVGPFLNGLPGGIFQQDNARPHTARVAQDSSMAGPLPHLSPVEHVWDHLKRQMPSCHSVHDLELTVQDLWTHLEVEVVQCSIEVAQYLCHCTPCIRLIVLFLRSSESLVCVIMCNKFHFNPMLSSWVAMFNVPECILPNQIMKGNIT
ncbi:DDE_3 domain-containing protein [Trichonephila clavipes]|uniref:DDE_3 domain-containing protein n=1 Tax=Trichonephila clavipes TaxID=2585209 RepID=A0A8X6VMS7_TRICX|nr:DDE_3 domain-containing protein [Trichonephila clavipes]